MNLLLSIKNWKDFSFLWILIQPFVKRLLEKNVPDRITKLYENLAKYSQPAINSLYKLKTKIKETPSEIDDFCFEQGVSAIETFANYLLETAKDLKS